MKPPATILPTDGVDCPMPTESFTPCRHSWWPCIAAGLTGEWSREAAMMDLRWYATEARVYGRTFPSRSTLTERWGWTDKRVRCLIDEDEWQDPDNRYVGPVRVRADSIDNDDGALFELPGPLTHADVVERARRWLLGKHNCRVAFAEIVTYERVNPDAIGFRKAGGALSSWSVLVEAKVSRSDFRADREKPIHRDPDSCPGQERWYLTPPNLVRPEEVPAGWGLAEVGKRTVRVVVPAPIGEFNVRRAHADFGILLAAVHRHQIGVEWIEDSGKFRPYGSVGGAR